MSALPLSFLLVLLLLCRIWVRRLVCSAAGNSLGGRRCLSRRLRSERERLSALLLRGETLLHGVLLLCHCLVMWHEAACFYLVGPHLLVGPHPLVVRPWHHLGVDRHRLRLVRGWFRHRPRTAVLLCWVLVPLRGGWLPGCRSAFLRAGTRTLAGGHGPRSCACPARRAARAPRARRELSAGPHSEL